MTTLWQWFLSRAISCKVPRSILTTPWRRPEFIPRRGVYRNGTIFQYRNGWILQNFSAVLWTFNFIKKLRSFAQGARRVDSVGRVRVRIALAVSCMSVCLFPNRGDCRRFGVSLISDLRPNRTREFILESDWAVISSWNSRPETLAGTTVRRPTCCIIT